ncbi:hypothetical protein OFL75_29560 [Pseudomonas aeruginosa]|jgi:hypothetical protein|nr:MULTISPECIES: hypothetical protein [Pseudomonas]EKL3977857.1 hypothetical protein [Morganella morganii]KGS16476.1 hypothetical protein OA77_00010 [Pseudomonas coronafaciens]MBA4360829.1 hypothetical protein [Pseudomonas sp.]MBU0903221.1 hypothetical protein [Gammaproteobacteria bacterium]APO80989.1 hypothetical protein BL240_05705 [Pseudomonas putida]
MRNAITYTVLATFIALGTVATGFAEQAKAPAQSSAETNKGEDMHMMDGNHMPMMDMQEMSKMMKNCNTMMENMNQHIGMESPKGDSKAQ